MNRQPLLSSIDLWRNHELVCTRLLREALMMLADRSPHEDENDLNRCLYRAIIRASYEADRRGEIVPVVVPEGRNPPASSDVERAEREFKIPDFYWAYIDPHANDPNDAAKQFVVECKRLTDPRTYYTREYVKSGVKRFIDVSHGYGKGTQSGAMIGYLQMMHIDDALARVIALLYSESISPLIPRSRDGEKRAEFDHYIIHPFQGSPFRLVHIWGRIGYGPSP